MTQEIKMDGVAFSVTHIQTFNTAAEFVAWGERKHFPSSDIKDRRMKLREVWKLANKGKKQGKKDGDNSGIEQQAQ